MILRVEIPDDEIGNTFDVETPEEVVPMIREGLEEFFNSNCFNVLLIKENS